MDGLSLHIPTLLVAARAVGLVVIEVEGLLTVRSPKGAGSLARLLLSRKADVRVPRGCSPGPTGRGPARRVR